MQEQLLAALLGAYEQLTECMKMYEDLERIAIEQEAEERIKTERLVRPMILPTPHCQATSTDPLSSLLTPMDIISTNSFCRFRP